MHLFFIGPIYIYIIIMTGTNKWALITGVSAGGLGDALAKELLSNNINVIITGLQLSHLDYFTHTANSHVERLQLDVTSTTSISAAVQAVTELTGSRLDILVNNAGYGYMMPLLDADLAKVKANFDVNVFGVLAVTQSFFPLLRAAGGMVVNQASIAGLPHICQPFIGSYSASKTAVVDLSNTLRMELAPFGVQVSDAAGSV
jgi:short-subunit dehydrogenase